MQPLRPAQVVLLALVGAAPLGTPSVAGAANIEVITGVLKVDVPRTTASASPSGKTGATVTPLAGGGALVGLFGDINPAALSIGAGCTQVATSNLSTRPPGMPADNAVVGAACDTTGVVGIRGNLHAADRPQVWFSSLALPTHVVATPGLPESGVALNDVIITGPGSDTIDAGNGPDDIDPGGAPYKGQVVGPGVTGEFEDCHRNLINAGAGNDTIRLGTATDVRSSTAAPAPAPTA